MSTGEDLRKLFKRIDGKGFTSYRDSKGTYDFSTFTLSIDHVQADPFASPSRVRVGVEMSATGLLPGLWNTPAKKTALEDYLARQFNRAIVQCGGGRRGTGKSGLIAIDCNGQYVIKRNALSVSDALLEVRFVVGLPARGRTVLGSEATRIFLDELPRMVEQALFVRRLDLVEMNRFIETAEDQEELRRWLTREGLVAFIADGSILPRRNGVDDRPLVRGAIPFYSPGDLALTVELLNRGPVRGMAIPPGVTLIVGGGFHGKSTLLHALERGVYNHIPGDGREYVVTRLESVKIRAEDGRSVQKVSISPFIDNLPFQKDTARFTTENASGSTSQAANIIESLESGAGVLFLDEDTSATNFMIRDERMQELVSKEKEPITPFIDKVRKLYHDLGVSTVLVTGGSGDYFDVADTVIMMDEYHPRAVTARAKEIAVKHAVKRRDEGGDSFGEVFQRRPHPGSFDASQGRKAVRIAVAGADTILYGESRIDLSSIEQLIDSGQTRCIGHIIYYYAKHCCSEFSTLMEGLSEVMRRVEEEGLDILLPYKAGNLALPRIFEVAAAINRMRSLRVE